jgi:hypothetical protein
LVGGSFKVKVYTVKSKIVYVSVFCLIVVSCSSMPTAVPTITANSTVTLTLIPPTKTNTDTAIPTKTPQPELTIADVGLPWNPIAVNGRVQIMPGYLFTSTMFHAGDGFYFPRGNSDTVYTVIAPADGVIVAATDLSDFGIGWEINVETPYLLDGKPVFYDVVHSSGLVDELRVGMEVHRGDPLVTKTNEFLDPAGLWLIDIGFRNGFRQANASIPEWTGLGYFSFTRLLEDDLALLNQNQFLVLPVCSGNPIQQTKPYMTPTPGGYTYP